MHDHDAEQAEEGVRRCSACGGEFPVDQFPRDRTKRGGRATQCRDCKRAAARRWREADPERARASVRRTYAKRGAEYRRKAKERYAVDGAARRQAWREANRDRDRASGRRSYQRHRDRRRAEAQDRYKANPERAKQQAKAWARENRKKRSVIMAFQNAKRRSRKKANGGRGFTKSHWREVVSRADGLCAYCRTAPAGSIDHFVPLSRGGPDDFANIVPACRRCNSLKREAEPEQWVVSTFGAERLAFVLSIMLH